MWAVQFAVLLIVLLCLTLNCIMRLIILFVFCFATGLQATAQTLLLSDSNKTYDVSKQIHYAVDANSNKDIFDIKKGSTQWQSFKNGQTPNFGIRHEAFWFTFNMQNNSNRDEWILHVDYRTLDYVSIFVMDSAGALLFSDTQGILTPNLHKQRMPVFEIDLPKGSFVRVYMRVQTSSLLIFPLKVSTPMAFCEIENSQRNVYLPPWGILIAALLFNLVLLGTSREKSFLFLSLSIAAQICFIGVVVGLFYEYIPFNPPVVLQKLRFILIGLVYGFHVLFAFYYLDLKNHKNVWWAEVATFSYFFLYSIMAGSGILNPYISGMLLVPTNILFFAVQFIIAVHLTIDKGRMASYYLVSFVPVFLAMLLYIAVVNSWVGVNLFFSNSGLYASALFTILLTSGLTEKMIKVKHETARANQLEIDKIALKTEIAHRITIEKELLESELRFHKLFELAPVPVLLTEYESGKIVDANLSLCDFTGFEKEAFVGKTSYEMGFIDIHKRAELYGLISQNKFVSAYETVIMAQGKPRIALLFMSVLNILNEKFIITLVSDITSQKEAEIKLKELNLTKDKFFSIIAHDLVNPFHAMILYSKELKVFTAGNERAVSYNNNLLLTAQNTYNLLQNLLTWSRAQTNQISFNPQPINLGDIVAETVSQALPIAQSKQIEIINEVGGDIQIEADVQMITLVLRNLISNSIKFSFKLGLVKIQSRIGENDIGILVIDKGTGMEQHETNKLFNMFETDQRPGTAGEAGTGLGLVICSEFVNYHLGSIQVISEPGKGSTFMVTLPKKQK